jgi:signal transduction histidine kinase
LRFALPWAQRQTRRVWAFIAIEVALLICISAQVNGAAITIISVSVALRSAELLRPPGALYATGVLLAVVLVAMAFWGRAQGISWNTIGDWAVITSLAWGLTGALTSFAAGERQANAELRKYAAIAADVAAVKERGRIALELHDMIGHALTALNVQLESALRLRDRDPAAADALIVSSKSLGSEALEDVRRTVARLRADPLERRPLDEVMVRLCERFEKTFTIDVVRALAPVTGDPATNTAVIRILEEAFNNVARHAGGSRIDLRLGRLAERNVLEMRDDGCGFDTNDHIAGHGLAIMRERASAADIDLAVHSAPGSGTLVRMTWNFS